MRGPFIKADIIQRDELNDISMAASYKAAEIACTRRFALLDARKSFATETVSSHPSKLEIIDGARRHGYSVIVVHVGVDSSDLSVARVKTRTDEGSHDVPEEQTRACNDRGQPLIREAALRADRGMVYDNSRLHEPPRQILIFARGRLSQADTHLPEWVMSAYAHDLVV